MTGIESWVVVLSGRPETYIAVALILAIGAVIPPLPTQSLVVAVGALLIARGDATRPAPRAVLGVTTVAGMVAGDLLAYGSARLILQVGDRHRRPLCRLPRPLASVEARVKAMRSRFERRPTFTMAIARLVPTGRIASDLLAADARVPLLSFARMTAAGGVMFAIFCLTLAILAGPFANRAPVPGHGFFLNALLDNTVHCCWWFVKRAGDGGTGKYSRSDPIMCVPAVLDARVRLCAEFIMLKSDARSTRRMRAQAW